ncbi:hypothetical protein Pse7367_0699 [Thalassoporum mexicanum PCC 7367]|uniref:DUF1517 domain-containing protein n=1 Tax=Thalassoporum mexicanum TaxID=3457544 RepID=UPI00029F9B87|nr:DUF1517 domain-containing protein [Pseudanabaena sp. PCC 7367]AFY69001.1 hypothetical protein Pse7367_0699 [Pseudanabaena sp. PCC 7367]
MKRFRTWWRSIAAIGLAFVLIFASAAPAFAARGGGRIGGGSFRRMPTRSYSAPRSRGGNYGGGGYYGRGFSGGSGFFFLPFFLGGSGGGLFGILVFIAIASVVMRSLRGFVGDGDGDGALGLGTDSNKVGVAKVQVGLLATARELQRDLTRLAMDSDTSTPQGLATILQEATVSLMRHPEYWVYVDSQKYTTGMAAAEQKFNGLLMAERSKLNAEVLSNVNNRLNGINGKQSQPELTGDAIEDPSEYIVVTLIVAAQNKALDRVGAVRSTGDLSQALSSLGAIAADDLYALEILWEPQSPEFTLSGDEVISIYPNLIRV